MYPQLSSYLRYSLTFVKKETMTLVSAFTRDALPPKPPECLDDDGVGFQEALAEHNGLNLWNVKRRRCLLAPYTNFQRFVHLNSIIKRLKLLSVTLSLVQCSRFLTTSERQHVQVASTANQGLWEPPHRYLEPKRQ